MRPKLVILVLVTLAACGGDSLPEPGVTIHAQLPEAGVSIGCGAMEPTPGTLAEVCADPARFQTRRFTVAGDWQQGQGSCTAAGCSPGTCCNACESKYTLLCPDGVTTLALLPGPELSELPGFQGACGLSDGCPIYVRLGCAGSGGGGDGTDCSADWACTPDAATVCSATGVVTSFYEDRIQMRVDAIELSVAP